MPQSLKNRQIKFLRHYRLAQTGVNIFGYWIYAADEYYGPWAHESQARRAYALWRMDLINLNPERWPRVLTAKIEAA